MTSLLGDFTLGESALGDLGESGDDALRVRTQPTFAVFPDAHTSVSVPLAVTFGVFYTRAAVTSG